VVATAAVQAQFRWPWRAMRRALEETAARTPKDQPVTRAYVTPTGAAPLPTMGAHAHWLRPGERVRAGRSTASRVFHVIEGRGQSRVGDTRVTWERGDTFVAPPWHWIEHENADAAAPASLFAYDDEPAIRALGLWQEERP
jgi:gentisate 1,2-dioxygenase